MVPSGLNETRFLGLSFLFDFLRIETIGLELVLLNVILLRESFLLLLLLLNILFPVFGLKRFDALLSFKGLAILLTEPILYKFVELFIIVFG